MHAAAVEVELLIPGSQSLKAKRKVLNSVVSRLRNRYPIAVAEVGHQDMWQRAALGLGFVSGERGRLDTAIAEVLRTLDARLDVEVVTSTVRYLEEPE